MTQKPFSEAVRPLDLKKKMSQWETFLPLHWDMRVIGPDIRTKTFFEYLS